MPQDGPVKRFFGIHSPDPATRHAAIEHPGPTWREWFYFDFVKVWTLLGFFIVDILIVAGFLEPPNLAALLSGLFVAFYLEFLLYRYLWLRPDPEERIRPGDFRPTWTRPSIRGRWTPEAWKIRAGEMPAETGPGTPDPREFL